MVQKKHPVSEATDKTPDSQPESFLKRQHLFGDWGGRTELVEDGKKINDAVGGALAPISTLDVQDFTQLTAYSFEQSLCNGKFRFKFGQ